MEPDASKTIIASSVQGVGVPSAACVAGGAAKTVRKCERKKAA